MRDKKVTKYWLAWIAIVDLVLFFAAPASAEMTHIRYSSVPFIGEAPSYVAYSKGFLLVSASPLTRSSYHADEDFNRLRAARESGHPVSRGT